MPSDSIGYMDFPSRENKNLMPKYGKKYWDGPDENNNRSVHCKLGGSDSLTFKYNPLHFLTSLKF